MTAMLPVVSVLMSVYQASATLERALVSVLDQDWRDLELIVVDDGSSDGFAHQLDAWARRDARVRVHRQPNAGLAQALVQASTRQPHSYFMFLRIAFCVDITFLLSGLWSQLSGGLRFVFVSLAVLCNPILPVHVGSCGLRTLGALESPVVDTGVGGCRPTLVVTGMRRGVAGRCPTRR